MTELRPTRMSPNDAEELEASLTRTLGALIGGEALSKTLGYRTQSAFRRALARGRVPVHVFTIEGRRGRFALAKDLATWLHRERCRSSERPANVAQAPPQEVTRE
jgi:hypothetical protein